MEDAEIVTCLLLPTKKTPGYGFTSIHEYSIFTTSTTVRKLLIQ